MKRKDLCFVLVAALTLMLSPLASAAVIFDNGGPDSGFGPGTSTLGDGLFVGADDFQLQAGATTITDVHWWGGYAGDQVSNVDDFTIRIFADDGGAPEETPSVLNLNVGNVTRVPTGGVLGLLDAYAYWVFIDPVELQSDTVYYLSIANNIDVLDGAAWAWAKSDTDAGLLWARQDDTGPWSQPGATGRAFNLTSVPEPSGLLLAALALLGLLAHGRRRCKA